MCGIAGIIYKEKAGGNQADIEKMTALVEHRGPDGIGYWHEDSVYFGHRRLAIIDLSDGGAQPMEYNGYVITYNGEIYNYLELKQELGRAGYYFKSQSDTEVILAAYQCWGADCLQRFNGMWAFAIYDPFKKQVFCSRDRFGIKPFYYYEQEDKFLFGSEIRQLLAFCKRPTANMQAIAHYLLFNLTDYCNATFFNDINSLPGGYYLVYDLPSSAFSIRQYYDINVNADYAKLGYEEARELFQQHFQRSIEWRLRSDVKVGTCLSGGLDSSFIAWQASTQYSNQSTKFSAFTASSIDENWDESHYAKQVADSLDLDWHVTQPTAEQFLKSIDEVCSAQEEPFVSPSIFMQYETMRLANSQGLKVLLDGQGADETLMGYDRYIIARSRQIKGWRRFGYFLEASKNYQTSLVSLLKMQFYFSDYGLRKRMAPFRIKGLQPGLLDHADDDYLRQLTESFHNPLALQQMEIKSSHLPALLRYEDRNSMHFSIETRLPYLDWQLLEFNLSIPAAYKMRDGWSKYLLRDSMNKKLPESIVWRKKKFAFDAPSELWLQNRLAFQATIQDSVIIRHVFKKIPNPENVGFSLLWKLVNIASWEKAFGIGIFS